MARHSDTPRSFWLFKTEPTSFSIEHWLKLPSQVALWDGVRNYQSRNTLRDLVKTGDHVLIHYSSCTIPGIAGLATVVEAGIPDPSAFDPSSPYFDPKSIPASPTWFSVRLKLARCFARLVPLSTLKVTPGLETMMVCRRGARLSIQPVTPEEYRIVLKLAGIKG